MPTQNDHNTSPTKRTQTGDHIALFILGLCSAVGGVLAFVLLQVGLPVHTSALAAPQENMPAITSETATPSDRADSPGIGHQDSLNEVPSQLVPVREDLMVHMKSFVVALNEPGKPRYLKITIAAEVMSRGLHHEVEARSAEIRDVLIPYFSSLSLAKTRDIRGKQQIRRKTKQLINALLTTGQIERIFIFEFITQ
jgi:flagellar basal body-associated protein FliL